MFTVKIQKSDFKNPAKWQEVVESLELPPERSEAIVMRIPGLLPVGEGAEITTNIPQPSEWLWADDVGAKHSYIIHTHQPRFIAEMSDEDELHPPFEFCLKTGEMLCNFTWLDPPPEDLTQVLNEAETFILEYDKKNLGAD